MSGKAAVSRKIPKIGKAEAYGGFVGDEIGATLVREDRVVHDRVGVTHCDQGEVRRRIIVKQSKCGNEVETVDNEWQEKGREGRMCPPR